MARLLWGERGITLASTADLFHVNDEGEAAESGVGPDGDWQFELEGIT